MFLISLINVIQTYLKTKLLAGNLSDFLSPQNQESEVSLSNAVACLFNLPVHSRPDCQGKGFMASIVYLAINSNCCVLWSAAVVTVCILSWTIVLLWSVVSPPSWNPFPRPVSELGCPSFLGLSMSSQNTFTTYSVQLSQTLSVSLGCHQVFCQIQKFVPRELINNRLKEIIETRNWYLGLLGLPNKYSTGVKKGLWQGIIKHLMK